MRNSKKKSRFRLSEIYLSGKSRSIENRRSTYKSSVISSAIVVQLRELELACESAFSTMSRTAWNTLNQVVGQSPYTHEVVKVAEQVADTIKPHVEQKKYLRNFFDKACRYVFRLVERTSPKGPA